MRTEDGGGNQAGREPPRLIATVVLEGRGDIDQRPLSDVEANDSALR